MKRRPPIYTNSFDIIIKELERIKLNPSPYEKKLLNDLAVGLAKRKKENII